MTDPKGPIFRIDERAILKGSEVAFDYLDSIKKTDFATMSKAEWIAFATKLVGGSFLAAVGDVYGDQIPF